MGLLSALFGPPKPPPAPPTTHGSARWASNEDLAALNLLGDDREGFTLGLRSRELRYRGDRHRLIVAPARSGKFVSCVGPMLLDDVRQSIIMVDIKGEGLAITRRHRCANHDPAWHLNPYGLHNMGSHKYNPMRLLDPSKPSFIADGDMLVESMVVPAEKGDTHFEDSGKYFLKTLLRYVASSPDEEGRRTLNRLRGLLMLPAPELMALMEKMSFSSIAYGLVKQGADAFAQMHERERSGVLSTAKRQTEFLDDPLIKDVLRGHNFSFADLKQKLGTVYLVLPADLLPARREWLRLMIGCALVELKRVPLGYGMTQVAFLIDEFPALGSMKEVLNDYSVAAGYGVQFHLVCQNFGQLERHYQRSWESFVSSAGIIQAFSTQDMMTAEYISKMLGVQTVEFRTRSGGHSSSPGGGTSSHNWSDAQAQRPLLTPDEVRTLEQRAGYPCTLLLPNGGNPAMAHRWLYYAHKPFAGRADPPPKL